MADSAAGDHPPLHPESLRAARIDAAISSTRLRPSSTGGVYQFRFLFAILKFNSAPWREATLRSSKRENVETLRPPDQSDERDMDFIMADRSGPSR